MFTTNPFIPLTDFMPPAVLQGNIVLMVLAAAIGTVLDLLHGKKIRFFLQARQQVRAAIAGRLLAPDECPMRPATGAAVRANRFLGSLLASMTFALSTPSSRKRN